MGLRVDQTCKTKIRELEGIAVDPSKMEHAGNNPKNLNSAVCCGINFKLPNAQRTEIPKMGLGGGGGGQEKCLKKQ